MLYTVHISCSNEFEPKRAKILGSANGLRSALLQNPNHKDVLPIHKTIEKEYNQILNFGKEIEKIKGIKSISRNVGYFEGKAEPSYTLTCTQEALLPLCEYATKHQQISFIINRNVGYDKNAILGENTGGNFFRILFFENKFENITLSEYYLIEKIYSDTYAKDGFSIYLDHNYTNGVATFVGYLIPKENESQAEIIERIDTTEQSLRVLKNSLRQTIDIRSISESRRGSVESWYVGGKKQTQNQYDYKTQKEELKNYFSGLGSVSRPKVLKTQSQVIQYLNELDGLGFLGSIFLDNNKDDFEAHQQLFLDAIKWIKDDVFVTNKSIGITIDEKIATLEEYYKTLYDGKDKNKIYMYDQYE